MNLKQNLSLIRLRTMATDSFSFCYQQMLRQSDFSYGLSYHYDHSRVRLRNCGVHVYGVCDHYLYDGV